MTPCGHDTPSQSMNNKTNDIYHEANSRQSANTSRNMQKQMQRWRRLRPQLPSHELFAKTSECFARQTLGEDVCHLILRLDLFEAKTLTNFGPEVMELAKKVASARSDSLRSRQGQGGGVILENRRACSSSSRKLELELFAHFSSQGAERKEFQGHHAEGLVLRLHRRQADGREKLRLPNQGAPTEQDDMSSTRSRTVGTVRRLTAPKTSKVGITTPVKVQVSCGLKDETLISR